MDRIPFSFGSYITANLFVPAKFSTATELPVFIFLHGFSYQLGYSGIYGLYHSEDLGGLIPALVGQGVAVLAWDMTGMGARQDEGAPRFYRRLPASSRLGLMVGEIAAALDMIHCAGMCGDGWGWRCLWARVGGYGCVSSCVPGLHLTVPHSLCLRTLARLCASPTCQLYV